MNTATYQERITIGGETFTYTRSKSAGSLVVLSETIAESATDAEINFALDISECEFFAIVCTQDLFIETNDGTTPDDTLSLIANQPYVWASEMLDQFVIENDITSLFVTNAAEECTLTIWALFDPTP